MSGGYDCGNIRDEIATRIATGEMSACRFGHGQTALLLENNFHVFTLHGRLLRDTRSKRPCSVKTWKLFSSNKAVCPCPKRHALISPVAILVAISSRMLPQS